MIIVLTNDDGVDADGLKALAAAAGQVFPEAEVWTIAPAGAMSQVGHRVTTTESIPIERRAERIWAVHGTPADCVRIALSHLLPGRPDWVLSGINHGGNMGQDIYISGTVAAVREAAYHGVPGIACSHYIRRELPLDWTQAAERAASVMTRLIHEPLGDGEHWNINLPHEPAGHTSPQALEAHMARAPLPVSFEAGEFGLNYTGVYSERPHEPDTDVDVCFSGNIAVTRLRI